MTYTGELITRADVNGFIPNMWANDIRRKRDATFHMQRMIRYRSFVGKKGSTYFEPLVGRFAVYPVVEGQRVRFQRRAPGTYQMLIDQEKESSFAVTDIAELQSQYNFRTPYIEESGYALRRDLNNAILALRAAVPAAQQLFNTSDGTVAGTPLAISDDVVKSAMQYMMEEDVPLEGLVWSVAPSQYWDLLSIDKFISRDFIDGRPVVNGVLGTLYGVPVITSSEVKVNSLDGFRNGDGAIPQPTPGVAGSPYMPTQDDIVNGGLPLGQTGNEAAAPFVTATLAHADWGILAVQKDVSTEYGRLFELQSDGVVSKQVYGAKGYRLSDAILVHTAA